ncbi:DNA-protecting protein DprA [Aphanizomenon flos-aquae FACHB-1416]|uniref:DNA-protecting protein DprA n=1 Tax=Aphanizomenon flos-aquae FACHB-1249 TaxID=2692889 RepID=A0ABR8IW75_APHFL|nr:DNA-protecting protein DprA [Aphanizomenon flos-aquae FACHB-1171]MBD2558505.1 DNA-protecting protein DprA [Aphanizomenon flos-aquae FACHB-1290]MBD2632475.1 DNA-protecting protein DprA [Aphanizomenon sp. FACHB-1399]MBD2643377.1 DNA-protecting protein DprA [Aphanizomenon sp. FACHB-1401]MBD2656600.1 DNA-protecting protein DprA [Aphanizomenon flos-aquae FACHB-1265]MBD2672824.1 DNA-protecting protein DprA [Aphanizomenon flos-aquae FACHB-1416]MBD2686343.1 DNA-protecting protein DprA [Aphanizomen
MSNHILPPDTQAILLLCASFGQNRQTEPLPLTLSEYNLLTEWLLENQMRPGDLLETTAIEKIQKITINKLNPDRLIALLERGLMLSLAVEKWTSQGLWILGRSDPKYPQRFKQILKHSAPAIIYGVGNVELLSLGGLAIVGSRDVDEEMIQYTQRVAKTCSQQNIQVISGGARGIDQESMLGILNNRGTCVGVLADSLTKAAVNSKYRSGIREGRLTLISSYDPDAGFNTGNAMGRNKYIYSLADYALVVKSDLEKGGTWNGAVEALSKIKEIPVFVNMIYPIAAGNQELYNRGAKQFPLEFDNGNLQEMLVKTIGDFESIKKEVITTQPEYNDNTISQSLTTIPKDIYNVVLPVILSHLQQPKDAKSLADSLQVRKVQMDDWLTRAINEGKVIKTKIEKRVAYVVNQADTQLSLL